MATSTKKLGTPCLEDKENHQPEEKTTKKSDEKKIDKFPVPKIAPDDDGPREPLSTRVVNTMRSYMRASSSVNETKRILIGKIHTVYDIQLIIYNVV